jgi:ribosomal protein S18 acetylase RimI-like enzyme
MQKKFYRKNIRSPKSLFFVAELDGKLIGFALAFARKYSPPVYAWKKEATLSDLYVEKPFRGKGVGERLFKEVAKFAENKGADMIKLHVDSKNAGARRFYEKMGMKDFHVLMVLRVKR